MLRKVMALCQCHGVTLNLHNHTYEVEHDLHDLKGTLARIPGVKLGPDLNWLVVAEWIRSGSCGTTATRSCFSTCATRNATAHGRSHGGGQHDYRAIAAALREINFAGDAVIELAHPAGFKAHPPAAGEPQDQPSVRAHHTGY